MIGYQQSIWSFMRNKRSIFFLIFTILLFLVSVDAFAQNSPSDKDTINRVDASKLKQGYWIIKDRSLQNVIEEGVFVNNKKSGLWKGYFTSGKLKYLINYVDNKPFGNAKLYYESGQLAEEGTWQENKWVGPYKYYYPNGALFYDWKFDESGKRTGEQKYYHENGKPMYEGEWKDGKNSNNLTIFDETGVKIGERVYKDSKFAETINYGTAVKETKNTASKDYLDFNLTGNSTTVNMNGKVDRSGYFEKGKLMDGTSFEYDDNDNLIRKTIYRGGEVIKVVEIKE